MVYRTREITVNRVSDPALIRSLNILVTRPFSPLCTNLSNNLQSEHPKYSMFRKKYKKLTPFKVSLAMQNKVFYNFIQWHLNAIKQLIL